MKKSVLVVDDQIKNLLTTLGNLASKGAVVEVQSLMNQLMSQVKEECCSEKSAENHA